MRVVEAVVAYSVLTIQGLQVLQGGNLFRLCSLWSIWGLCST